MFFKVVHGAGCICFSLCSAFTLTLCWCWFILWLFLNKSFYGSISFVSHSSSLALNYLNALFYWYALYFLLKTRLLLTLCVLAPSFIFLSFVWDWTSHSYSFSLRHKSTSGKSLKIDLVYGHISFDILLISPSTFIHINTVHCTVVESGEIPKDQSTFLFLWTDS